MAGYHGSATPEYSAEFISKYVSHNYFPTKDHAETIKTEPEVRIRVANILFTHLNNALFYYQTTIDEVSLAFYFAYLLMDDDAVTASNREHKERDIEISFISNIRNESCRNQLWKMKKLLEIQLNKKEFWIINEDFLLNIGTCIGELILAKIKELSRNVYL